jgi:hypothetical protein
MSKAETPPLNPVLLPTYTVPPDALIGVLALLLMRSFSHNGSPELISQPTTFLSALTTVEPVTAGGASALQACGRSFTHNVLPVALPLAIIALSVV